MRFTSKTFFIYLAIYVISCASVGFSIVVDIGLIGIPSALSHLVIFFLFNLITYSSLHSTRDVLTTRQIIITIVCGWFTLFLPKALTSSLNFTITIIPFFISFLLGVIGGYVLYRKRTFNASIFLALIPLSFTLGMAEKWNNRIVYGTVDEQTQLMVAPEFSFLDQKENVISNQSLKGKIAILDFWFISCRPCWVKFPVLQEIYDQHKSNDQIVFYAVNRPMSNDKPDQLFTSIEKKDFTFPVGRGSEQLMEVLEIDYFPTVLIIDAEGNITYRGGIENVENELNKLLP